MKSTNSSDFLKPGTIYLSDYYKFSKDRKEKAILLTDCKVVPLSDNEQDIRMVVLSFVANNSIEQICFVHYDGWEVSLLKVATPLK